MESALNPIPFEEVISSIDRVVFTNVGRHLKDVEIIILKGSWQRQKYHEIAEVTNYTANYLAQDVGPKLWKLLSSVLGEEVSKTNFQSALERRWRSQLKPD